jgi:hypothetical protein
VNQPATIDKTGSLNPLAQKAAQEINKALKRACTFVNVEAPILDGEVASNRVKTPFDATFSFKFEPTSRFVNGNVNAGSIPVVRPDKVGSLRAKLRSDVLSRFATDEAIRARTMKAGYKAEKLFETDYAVCKDKCDGCSGAGSFHCSPCGGHGSRRCTNCANSGHVRCASCNGRGGTGNIPCTYCATKGWVLCHQCNGTLHVSCGNCSGHGHTICGGCRGDGIVSTVYHATFSVSGKLEAGPSALSKDNLDAVKLWVMAAFSKPVTFVSDAGGHMETDVSSASVFRGANDLEYKTSFNCYSTVSRMEFLFEGRKCWVEHTKTSLPIPKITFSNFLDSKALPAVELASLASTPSGVRKALKNSGYPKIAECFDKPDDFDFNVKYETNGAVSLKTMKPLEEHYLKSVEKFARSARRRAWKVPVLVTLGGWWTACHYDIPQAAADMESPLWMVALAFLAASIALITSNFEARYAIVSEANTLRGWRAGPAAYACAVAAATLFWTSSFYGFKI